MTSDIRTARAILVLLSYVFILTGCAFLIGRNLTVTPTRQILEQYVPADSWFVMSIDFSNETQRQYVKNMAGDDRKVLEMLLRYYGVFFEPKADFVPQAIISFQPGDSGDISRLDRSFVVSVRNSDELEKILQEELKETKQTNTQTWALQDNVFFMTNSIERKDALLGNGVKKNSLLKNKKFVRAVKTPQGGAKQRLGYLYIDPAGADQHGQFAVIQQFAQSIFINVSADANNLIVKSDILLDRSKIITNNRIGLLSNSDVYLDKKIRVAEPAFFIETTGLENVFLLQKDILKADGRLEKTFGSLADSFDTAPLSFLNRNIALVIEDQDILLPGITFVADAAHDMNAAKALLKKIDDGVNNFIATNRLTVADKPYLEKVDTGGVKGVRFYPKKFPQEEFSIPLFALIDEVWELRYGITQDNLLFISTADYPDRSASPIVSNLLYGSLAPELGDYLKTDRMFLQIKPITAWIERLIAFGQTNEYIDQSEKELLEQITAFLNNITGVISGTKLQGDFLNNKIIIRYQKS